MASIDLNQVFKTMSVNERDRLATSKDQGYGSIPPAKDYVQEARHIDALSLAIGQQDRNGQPRDPAAVEEYNRSLEAYNKQYGFNPGIVQTMNLQSSDSPDSKKNVGSMSTHDQMVENPDMILNNRETLMPKVNPAVPLIQNDPYNKEGGLISISDNTAPALNQTLNNKASEDNAKKVQQWKDELNKKKSTPPQDPSDPHGIDWLHGGSLQEWLTLDSQWTEAAKNDFIKAGPEIPKQVLGGIRDNIQHTAEHLQRLSTWMNQITAPATDAIWSAIKDLPGALPSVQEGNVKERAGQTPLAQLPEVAAPDTVTGGLVRGTSEFLSSFIPMFQALKAATYGKLAFKGLTALEGILAAGGASAVSSAPQEENLASLVQAHPNLANPVSAALATNPNDPAWENDLKNFAIGAGLTAIAEPFVAAIGAIKGMRQAKGVTAGIPALKVKPEDFSPAVKVTTPAAEGVKESTKLYGASPETPDHAAIIAGLPKETNAGAQVTPGFVNKVNEFHTPEEMQSALDQAKADQLAAVNKGNTIKFSAKPGEGSVDEAAFQDYLNGRGSLTKVMNTFSNTNMTSGANITQVVKRIAAMTFDKTAKVEPVGKADLSKMANRLGITPYELSRNHPEIVANNHLFESLNTMVDASKNSVSRLATELLNPKTANATGELSLYNFLRAINGHRAILSYLRSGNADSATEIFGKMPPVKGDIAAQVNQAAKFISDNGGATKVRTLAKLAIKDDKSFEQALRFSTKGNLSDMAMKYWYFNLLSNPLTQLRNVYGNTFHLLWQIPARNFGGEVNAVKQLFGYGSPGGVAVNEGNALAYGMTQSFREAWRLANKSWKTGLPSDETAKIDSNIVGNLTAADRGWSGLSAKAIDALSWIGSLPGKSLLSADEFTKAVAKIGELHALAYREGLAKGLDGADLEAFIKNGVANPTEGAMAEAFDFSHEIAFTKDLGQMGQRIMSLVNTPVMNFPVLKMIVPFIRTNVNMFKTNVANSPYAALSTQFWRDVSAGGARSDMALSKFALGSSAAILVVEGVLGDRITGYGPVDPGLRTTWMLTHKPNSFKIDGFGNKLLEKIPFVETAPDGSRWLNYGVLAHLSTMLSVTASLAESMGPMHPDDYHKAFHQVSMSLTQSVLSQSWGRSFSGFMDFLQGDMAGMQWLQNEVASIAVPAFVTSVAHLSDPIWRETNGFIDTIKSRIPGWLPGNVGSTSLNARHNIAGQPIYSQSLGPDIISPMYQFLPDNKPFFKWAWANQVPLQAPSKIQLGVDMKDDPANYQKFVMLAGNYAKINGKGWYDRMNDIIDGKDQYSGEWARGTDGPNGTRALIAKNLMAAYRKAAEIEMLKDPLFKHKVEQVSKQKRYNLLTAPGDMPQ